MRLKKILYLFGFLLIITWLNSMNASDNKLNYKLYPIDESSKNLDFKTFRDELMNAINKKDKDFLFEHLSSDIVNSFGGDGGIEEFKEMWDINSPDSKLWEELKRIILLGGTFSDDKKEFCAPYVYSKFPKELDTYTYGVIIDENVPVHSRPGSNASIITYISYDVIEVLEWRPIIKRKKGINYKWIKIQPPKKIQGYILEKYIRSPIDYRVCFKKIDEKWYITAFVSGD